MAKKSISKTQPVQTEQLAFGLPNYIGFAIGLFTIIIGFWTLSKGSITLAPILLVVGYCVIIPVSIMIKDKSEKVVGD